MKKWHISMTFLWILGLVYISGCTPKKPVIIDPCASVDRSCFGNAGEMPGDNKYCSQLAQCFDWEMRAK